MPIVAGCLLIWLPWGHNNGEHDKDGSLEWSLSNSSYHQATVSQIAWHKNTNQWGEGSKRGGGEINAKWVISLLLLLLSIHCKVSHSEELSLLLTDCPRSSFTNCFISRGHLLKQGLERLSHVFFTLEHHPYYRCGWATIHCQLSTSSSLSLIALWSYRVISRWIYSNQMWFRTVFFFPNFTAFNIK